MPAEKEYLIIKTYQIPDKVLMFFWVFLVQMSLLGIPATPPYVAFILIGISAAGLLLSVLKCTKVIVHINEDKRLITRKTLFRKLIPFSEIKESRHIHSVLYGNWFGVVWAKDLYGVSIQFSSSHKVAVHNQKHANNFEPYTLCN